MFLNEISNSSILKKSLKRILTMDKLVIHKVFQVLWFYLTFFYSLPVVSFNLSFSSFSRSSLDIKSTIKFIIPKIPYLFYFLLHWEHLLASTINKLFVSFKILHNFAVLYSISYILFHLSYYWYNLLIHL